MIVTDEVRLPGRKGLQYEQLLVAYDGSTQELVDGLCEQPVSSSLPFNDQIMGIPRFSSYLDKWGVSVSLGCQTLECSLHEREPQGRVGVVIDGPSLVHYIYNKVLEERLAKADILDSVLLCQKVGIDVVRFLDYLESIHIPILRLYFDGGLPVRKHETRVKRMAAYSQSLIDLRTVYPRGYPNHKKSASGRLLGHNLPIPPFLVPTALDHLNKCKYGSLTEVVPGEADPYCAHLAREKGAIILTNDSDLVVYDLGIEGAVAFFHGISYKAELSGHAPIKGCENLRARLWRSRDISHRLGVDLQRLAYEIKQIPPVRLAHAIENTKRPPLSMTDFDEFLLEYDLRAMSLPAREIPKAKSKPMFVDPRLHELLVQVLDLDVKEPHMYLPVLLSDPSRATAWQPSHLLRKTLYTLLFTAFRSQSNFPLGVLEHDPKRPSRPFLIPILEDLSNELKKLTSSLSTHVSFEHLALETCLSSWETVPTLSEVFPTNFRSWQHIQLLAQVHGFLYCLRLLGQVLRLITPMDPAHTVPPSGARTDVTVLHHEDLGSLDIKLGFLPDLTDLLPRSIRQEDYSKITTEIHDRDQSQHKREASESPTCPDVQVFAQVHNKNHKRKAFKPTRAGTDGNMVTSGYFGILATQE